MNESDWKDERRNSIQCICDHSTISANTNKTHLHANNAHTNFFFPKHIEQMFHSHSFHLFRCFAGSLYVIIILSGSLEKKYLQYWSFYFFFASFLACALPFVCLWAHALVHIKWSYSKLTEHSIQRLVWNSIFDYPGIWAHSIPSHSFSLDVRTRNCFKITENFIENILSKAFFQAERSKDWIRKKKISLKQLLFGYWKCNDTGYLDLSWTEILLLKLIDFKDAWEPFQWIKMKIKLKWCISLH